MRVKMVTNKRLIKKVYPTKKDLDVLINKTMRDFHEAGLYDTVESKMKAKRLDKFLSDLAEIRSEY